MYPRHSESSRGKRINKRRKPHLDRGCYSYPAQPFSLAHKLQNFLPSKLTVSLERHWICLKSIEVLPSYHCHDKNCYNAQPPPTARKPHVTSRLFSLALASAIISFLHYEESQEAPHANSLQIAIRFSFNPCSFMSLNTQITLDLKTKKKIIAHLEKSANI